MSTGYEKLGPNFRNRIIKAAGLRLGDDPNRTSTTDVWLISGTGAPSGAYMLPGASDTAIYLREDASSIDTMMYVTHDSGTAWTACDLGAVAPGTITLARGFVLAGNSSGVAAALDGGAAQGIIYSDGTDMLRGSLQNGGTGASGSSTASITVGGATDSDTASITVGGATDSDTASITVGGATDSDTASITVGGSTDSDTASITVGGSTDSDTASITVGGATDSDTASITVGGSTDSGTASITIGGSTDSDTASITMGGNTASGGESSYVALLPFAVLDAGGWAVDGDGARTNGGGLVGQVPTLTAVAATYCKVSDYGGGAPTYASVSNSSSLAGWAGNWQLFSDAANEEVNDYFAIGADVPFCEVAFNLSALATWGGDGMVYEYSQGSGVWATLTLTGGGGEGYDNTDTTAQNGLRSLQQNGAITFEPPALWATDTIDSQLAYWIRARVTAAQLTQTPVLNTNEPEIVTGEEGWRPPYAGTLNALVINDNAGTLHSTQDVIFIVHDSVSGEHRKFTFSQDRRRQRITCTAWALTTAARLSVYVIQEDTANEPSGVMLELEFTQTLAHAHGATGLTATDAGHTHGSTALTGTDAGHTHGSTALTATDAGHTHGSSALTATDAGHTHGSTALTATDAGHTHGSSALTATDAGHTHGSSALTATDAGHTHGSSALTATDAGHTHGSSALTATDAGHTHTGPSHTHTIA